jgi:hypothetical protein
VCVNLRPSRVRFLELIKFSRICGVIASVLVSSAVDCLFEPLFVSTKNYIIGNSCFSAKHAALRAKTCWLGIRIICLSGATSLSAECCFSELAHIQITTGCVDPVQSGHHNHRHHHHHHQASHQNDDMAEKLLIWC